MTGRELAGSGIAVYGPRTTITLALRGAEGAHEFLLVDDFTARHGQWVKTNTFTSIGYAYGGAGLSTHTLLSGGDRKGRA